MKKIITNILLVVVMIGLELIFWRSVIIAPDNLPGDTQDGMLASLLMEHHYQTLLGRVSYFDLPIFYPEEETLAYSDTLLLLGIPHTLLRLLGWSWLGAFRAVVIGIHVFGGLCWLYYLRHYLRLGMMGSVVGVVIANCSNAFFLSLGHLQMLVLCFIPLLAIGGTNFYHQCGRGGNLGRRRLWAIITLATFGAITFSSFYVGFFFSIWLGCVATLVLTLGFWKKMLTLKLLGKLASTHWRELLFYASVLALVLIPTARLYLPASMEFGRRSWRAEVSQMLPHWYDFINVSATNFVWEFPEDQSERYRWELCTGLPLVTFCLLVGATLASCWHFHKTANRKTTIAQLLGVSVLLAVWACFVLMLRWQNLSLWLLVYGLVPGGRAIRAVARFNVFLAMPIGVMIACWWQQFLVNGSKRWWWTWLMGVLVVFIILEHQNLTSRSNWKTTATSWLSEVPAPPADCQSFYLTNNDPTIHQYTKQLMAWAISNQFHLPTLHGYSGQSPPGWGESGCLERDCDQVSVWIEDHRLTNVCAYRVWERQWAHHSEEEKPESSVI